MAQTKGRVAKPDRRWGCRRGTPSSVISDHTICRIQNDISISMTIRSWVIASASQLCTQPQFTFYQTPQLNRLILFSADIRISRIYADNRKFT